MTSVKISDVPSALPDGLPRGRITFLFTDTEKSSHAWMGMDSETCRIQVKGEIHKRLENAIKDTPSVDGRPIQEYIVQDTGDGELIAFDYLFDALALAENFQIALRADPVQVELEPNGEKRFFTGAVRMAIHAAEEDVVPKWNALVNRFYYEHRETVKTHRVMSIAVGGQILLTASAYEGIRQNGKYRSEGAFRRWPGRRIKDLSTAETVFERMYDGWTSIEPGTASLPAWCIQELSHYVPRPHDEERVISAFNHENISGRRNHLVCIHADGGMGKSRLATEVAIRMSAFFDGGIFTKELPDLNVEASEGDKSRTLISEIATAVSEGNGKLTTQDEKGLLQFVKGQGNKRILIILHNYESVTCDASATVINNLLQSDKENCLYFLVTSRFPVVPSGRREPAEQIVPLRELPEDMARALFLDRVRRKDLDWEPTKNDDTAISTILKLTECIPLALELVAASSDEELTVLASELQESPLGEITGGNGKSGMKDTMLCSLDWSWNKLIERDQKALACLSLFAETTPYTEAFTLAAACGCFGWKAFKSPVTALCNASLVRRSETSSGTRYGMHRFVREYATARFAELPFPERTESEIGFVEFWAKWLEENDFMQLDSTGNWQDDDTKLPGLDREWRNIVLAQQLAIRRKMRHHSGILTNIINFLLEKRSQWHDAESVMLYYLEWMGSLSDKSDIDRDTETEVRYNLAGVYSKQRKIDAAVEVYEKCLVVFREIGNKQGEGVALHGLANELVDLKRFDDAIANYKLSIDIKHTRNDVDGEATSWTGLGEAYRKQSLSYHLQGDHEQASTKEKEAIAACEYCRRITKNVSYIASAWHHEGFIRLDRKELNRAEECFRFAVEFRRPLKNVFEIGLSLGKLGQVQLMQGNQNGLFLLEEALTFMEKTEDQVNIAWTRKELEKWRSLYNLVKL